ncbi:hypothetical protein XELAEV_18032286mg [Xenopus laevis]|uniref:Uncharacterized protein n=1 Tax=Xenopus laevis TaxID=8355 RepID=A0A974CQT4_XENLA|nr:hypothetical protein XELAEV_18032286mg [Xenopus laevis]
MGNKQKRIFKTLYHLCNFVFHCLKDHKGHWSSILRVAPVTCFPKGITGSQRSSHLWQLCFQVKTAVSLFFFLTFCPDLWELGR